MSMRMRFDLQCADVNHEVEKERKSTHTVWSQPLFSAPTRLFVLFGRVIRSGERRRSQNEKKENRHEQSG